MGRPRRVEQVEITLSYRLHDCAGSCCFVTATVQRSDGQMSVLDSRHLSLPAEALIDRALDLAKQLTYEHFLPLNEPF